MNRMVKPISRALLSLVPALWVALGCGAAQPSDEAGPSRLERVGRTKWQPWEAWRLRRTDRPPLDIFFSHPLERKPLLVLLQGSGCRPLFAIAEGGRRRMSSLLVQPEDVSKDVHVMAIEKVGVQSFDPSVDADAMRASPPCSEEYEANLAKDLRVGDVVDAIRAAKTLPWVGEILVAGHSEGADVAAGVGRSLAGEISGLGILSGAGATQLFDFVVENRTAGRHEIANQVLVEAFALNGPTPPARYRGHSLRRWQSFALESTPLDDLRSAPVPIFVAHGTVDESSRIENADLFVVEMLRSRHRAPLFYWVLDRLDHGYVDEANSSHAPEVIRRFVKWGLSPHKASGVELAALGKGEVPAARKQQCEQVADRALAILEREGDAKVRLAIAATPGIVRAQVVSECLRDATDASIGCLLSAPDLRTLKGCR